MAKRLTPMVVHVFPGMHRGGGPAGYAFCLKQALNQMGLSDIDILRMVVPPLQNDAHLTSGSSWRFEVLRKMPGVVSAMILFERERLMRKDSLERLGFSQQMTEMMRAAKVVVFHDVRIMASYLCSFRKPPGQTILLMSHAGSSLSAEIIKNWRANMKQTRFWNKISQCLIDDEFNTVLFADGLVAPYRESLDSFMLDHPNRALLLSKPVYEIPTGVPALESTKDREQVLLDLGISPEKIVIGFFGRHHVDKGYDYFCECAQKAMEDGLDALVFLTGGTGPIQSPKAPNFKDLGYITSELSNVMGAVDLVVSPSRVSYFELSILEAMSLGKSVITTKLGGSRRLEAPGVFLMEEMSGPLLLNRILQLTSDLSLLRTMAKQNRITYQCNYDLTAFAKRHVALAEQLIEEE